MASSSTVEVIGDVVRSRCPAAAARRAFRRWRRRSRTSAGTRTHACSWRRSLPCSPSGCGPATRRCRTPPGRSRSSPTIVPTRLGAPPRPPPEIVEGGGVDRSDGPIEGRVRRDVAEQGGLGAEAFDVRARLAAAGEHHHGVHQHGAAVMDRRSRERHRQRVAQPDPVGQSRQRGNPTWATTWSPPPSTTTLAALLPFTSEVPSRDGVLGSRQPQNPLPGGLFRGTRRSATSRVNDRANSRARRRGSPAAVMRTQRV